MTDVIVIGAGAAGMMAAITAASNGAKVLVIEKNTDGNLCEHQCFASAILRFLMKYKDTLKDAEIKDLKARVEQLETLMKQLLESKN